MTKRGTEVAITPAPGAQALVNIKASDVGAEVMDMVLGHGDLSKLDARGRVELIVALSNGIGVNPLGSPFRYILMRGEGGQKKLVLYFMATGAEQLRAVHGVLTHITSRVTENNMRIVTCEASLPGTDRMVESLGIVALEDYKGNKLQGQRYADALMKADTKALRRATLSLLGMTWLTSVLSVPATEDVIAELDMDAKTGEILNQDVIDAQIERDEAAPASRTRKPEPGSAPKGDTSHTPTPADESVTPLATGAPGDDDEAEAAAKALRWDQCIASIARREDVGLTEETVRVALDDLSQWANPKEALARVHEWMNEQMDAEVDAEVEAEDSGKPQQPTLV